MDDGEAEGRQIPLTWVDWDETPIIFANNFICQFQPGEFVLTIGQMFPPPLVGSHDEVREQADQIDFVPIRTLARVGMTRKRLVELISALEANLRNHDAASRAQNPLGGEADEPTDR